MSESSYDKDIMAARWKRSALSELKPSRDLLQTGNPRQALFWMHLAVEKALKAHVIKVTGKEPPYIHSLPRLAMLAGIELGQEQFAVVDELNAYQVEMRYGNVHSEEIIMADMAYTDKLMTSAEELVRWLTQKL